MLPRSSMFDTLSTGVLTGVDMAAAAAGSKAGGAGGAAAAAAAAEVEELKRLAGSWLRIFIDGLAALRAKALLAIWDAWYADEVENCAVVSSYWCSGVRAEVPSGGKAPLSTSGQCQGHLSTSAGLVRVSWLWFEYETTRRPKSFEGRAA